MKQIKKKRMIVLAILKSDWIKIIIKLIRRKIIENYVLFTVSLEYLKTLPY